MDPVLKSEDGFKVKFLIGAGFFFILAALSFGGFFHTQSFPQAPESRAESPAMPSAIHFDNMCDLSAVNTVMFTYWLDPAITETYTVKDGTVVGRQSSITPALQLTNDSVCEHPILLSNLEKVYPKVPGFNTEGRWFSSVVDDSINYYKFFFTGEAGKTYLTWENREIRKRYPEDIEKPSLKLFKHTVELKTGLTAEMRVFFAPIEDYRLESTFEEIAAQFPPRVGWGWGGSYIYK